MQFVEAILVGLVGIIALVVALVVVAAVFFALAITLPLAATAAAVVTIFFVVYIYLDTAAEHLSPEKPTNQREDGWFMSPGSYSTMTMSRDDDPSVEVYAIRQVWKDHAVTGADAVARIRSILISEADRATNVFDSGKWTLALIPYYFAVLVGIAIGLVLGTALVVAAALFLTIVVIATRTIAQITTWCSKGAETALFSVLRSSPRCPYNGGCGPFSLPVYACMKCSSLHAHLEPGRNGVWRQVCTCGARLPTLRMLGRYRLNAFCPNCRRLLPRGADVVPTSYLPLIGGTAAGKTVLLHLVLDSARQVLSSSGGALAFVSADDEQRLNTGIDRLAEGLTLAPTVESLPKAVMVELRIPGVTPRRIYLFDPAGEVYQDPEFKKALQYLSEAKNLVMLIDPLAMPMLRADIPAAAYDMIFAQDASIALEPGDRDPAEAIGRLIQSVDVSYNRIAAVLTKTDLIQKLDLDLDLDASQSSRRQWLGRFGLRTALTNLTHYTTEIRHFSSGFTTNKLKIAEILTWTAGINTQPTWLNRIQMRLNPSLLGHSFPVRGRMNRTPMSYLIWRRGYLCVAGGWLIAGAVTTALAISLFTWNLRHLIPF